MLHHICYKYACLRALPTEGSEVPYVHYGKRERVSSCPEIERHFNSPPRVEGSLSDSSIMPGQTTRASAVFTANRTPRLHFCFPVIPQSLHWFGGSFCVFVPFVSLLYYGVRVVNFALLGRGVSRLLSRGGTQSPLFSMLLQKLTFKTNLACPRHFVQSVSYFTLTTRTGQFQFKKVNKSTIENIYFKALQRKAFWKSSYVVFGLSKYKT